MGVPAYLIDHADEIKPGWLENIKHLGLTAGASAPEYLVTEVTTWLQEHTVVTAVREMDGEDETICFQLPNM